MIGLVETEDGEWRRPGINFIVLEAVHLLLFVFVFIGTYDLLVRGTLAGDYEAPGVGDAGVHNAAVQGNYLI